MSDIKRESGSRAELERLVQRACRQLLTAASFKRTAPKERQRRTPGKEWCVLTPLRYKEMTTGYLKSMRCAMRLPLSAAGCKQSWSD